MTKGKSLPRSSASRLRSRAIATRAHANIRGSEPQHGVVVEGATDAVPVRANLTVPLVTGAHRATTRRASAWARSNAVANISCQAAISPSRWPCGAHEIASEFRERAGACRDDRRERPAHGHRCRTASARATLPSPRLPAPCAEHPMRRVDAGRTRSRSLDRRYGKAVRLDQRNPRVPAPDEAIDGDRCPSAKETGSAAPSGSRRPVRVSGVRSETHALSRYPVLGRLTEPPRSDDQAPEHTRRTRRREIALSSIVIPARPLRHVSQAQDGRRRLETKRSRDQSPVACEPVRVVLTCRRADGEPALASSDAHAAREP